MIPSPPQILSIRPRSCLILILYIMAPGAFAQPSVDSLHGKTCLTAGCHAAEHVRGGPRHSPFLEGNCLACHVDHASSTPLLLKPDAESLCLSCHGGVQMSDGHLVHPADAPGCLSCHAPHQSRVRGLLRDEAPLRDCARCHEPFLQYAAQLRHRHKDFDPSGQCGNCHTAHRNAGNHYLREDVSDTCLTCHDLPIQLDNRPLRNVARELRESKFVHGAIAEAGCPTCHTPHGSVQPSLLGKSYPAGAYTGYDRANYQLCWSCHTPELAETEGAAATTGFRDGDLNLHRVHVTQQKRGRACHLCHEAHASSDSHLLRRTIRFQSWEAPLGWKPSADGGTCNSPCHESKTYRRVAVP